MSSNRAAKHFDDAYDIIQRPVLTEKTHLDLPTGIEEGKEHRARYVFEVHPKATKPQIKEAVETIFGVEVASVNTMLKKPKRKSFRTATGKGGSGFSKARKKAIIRLTVDSDPIDLI